MTADILQFGVKTVAFERRKYPRLRVPNIRAHPSTDTLQILNMSRRGMAIETSHPFAVGGSYLFELSDEGNSLLVEGRVSWCRRVSGPSPLGLWPERPFHTGVAFVAILTRAQSLPVEHLSTLPPAAADISASERDVTAERVARLKSASCANEAAEVMLELLSLDFERLVLLRVVEDSARAWMARGPGLIPGRLRRLRLSLAQASILLHLKEGGSFFYGTLPDMLPHLQLLRCWQGDPRQECALFPVRVGGRLVAVLYADPGDRPLIPDDLGSLQFATALFSASLVDQILRRKSAARTPGA